MELLFTLSAMIALVLSILNHVELQEEKKRLQTKIDILQHQINNDR